MPISTDTGVGKPNGQSCLYKQSSYTLSFNAKSDSSSNPCLGFKLFDFYTPKYAPKKIRFNYKGFAETFSPLKNFQ